MLDMGKRGWRYKTMIMMLSSNFREAGCFVVFVCLRVLFIFEEDFPFQICWVVSFLGNCPLIRLLSEV